MSKSAILMCEHRSYGQPWHFLYTAYVCVQRANSEQTTICSLLSMMDTNGQLSQVYIQCFIITCPKIYMVW